MNMSVIRCPNCEGIVSLKAPRCPHCLIPIEEILKTTFALLPSSEADQHRAEYDFMQDINLHNNYRVSNNGMLVAYNHSLKILRIPEFVRYIPAGEFFDEHHGEYVTESHDGFFENNQNIEEVYIPSVINSIPVRAFQLCKKLKKVVLPEGLTVIDENAFYGCESLEEIAFPSTLQEIGICAFKKCKSLKSIIIPENMQWIRDGAFAQCEGLHSVHIEGGKKDLYITDKQKSYNSNTFERCDALEKVEIGLRPNLSSIATTSLMSRNLKQIIISDEYKDEGYEVTIRNGVAELTQCHIVDGTLIAYIGKNEKVLQIPDNVRRIKATTFSNCNAATVIYIGENIDYIAEGSFSQFQNVKEFQVHPLNKKYRVVNSILFSNDLQTLLCYPPQKEGDTYMVPHCVTRIANYSFSNVKFLKNLFFPDSVKEIGDQAIVQGPFSCNRICNIRYPASFQK